MLCLCTQEPSAEKEPEQLQKRKALGTISLKTYYNFFKAGGGILLVLITVLLFVLGEVCCSAIDSRYPALANIYAGGNSRVRLVVI